jgi:hypothetical protein
VADAAAFRRALSRFPASYFLHLSEGIPPDRGSTIARDQFLALQLPDQTWAIHGGLIGIHATGLTAEDFAILGQQAALAGGSASIVWSPLSNLLLYGATTNVGAAKANGVRITLGSDWSPSGSRNLLGELKVARVYDDQHGEHISDRELVAMVTSEAAKALQWDAALGSLEPGKRADLIVIDGQDRGRYSQLLHATEADVELVIIDGIPRYGLRGTLDALGIDGEDWTLGSSPRRFNLTDAANTPEIAALTLAEASDRLRTGMASFPTPPPLAIPEPIGMAPGARPTRWRLVLDNDGLEARAHRPLAPITTAEVIAAYWAASIPLEQLVTPMELDPLTVAEDPDDYISRLARQRNLPATVLDGLRAIYHA